MYDRHVENLCDAKSLEIKVSELEAAKEEAATGRDVEVSQAQEAAKKEVDKQLIFRARREVREICVVCDCDCSGSGRDMTQLGLANSDR